MDMKIREIEAFDLYGDGTLVLKTNLENADEQVQYAWYVKKGDRNIFKGSYQSKPFMAYKIPVLGAYTIKAFVKNKDGEKTEETITFVADRNTSPQLSAANELSVKGRPAVEHISGRFYKMSLPMELPQNALFAWYIHRNGETEPIARRMYSDSPEYVHAFQEPGEYYAKAFIVVGKAKTSLKSTLFIVK